MSASIEIKVDDAEIRDLLEQLGRRAENLLPAMKRGAEHMLFSVQENFSQGGRPTRWLPSARAIRQGGQTLVDTRRLESSLTYRADQDSFRVGTNVVYARPHQFGVNRMVEIPTHKRLVKKAFGKTLKFPVWATIERYARHMNLPARPFLLVQDEDRDELRFIIRDFLLKRGEA